MVGDCRLITMSKLLEKSSITLSPAMCFGIGEGYDFKYWIEKNLKVPMIVMMGNNNCDETLLNNIGLNYEIINASHNLDLILNCNNNVMVDVDRYYLDYLGSKFGRSHFGKHVLLLSKCDEQNYLCFDALDDSISQIGKEVVEKARFSEIQPFPPEGKGIYLSDVSQININEEIIKDVISNNMKQYISSDNHGIARFKSFIKQLEMLLPMLGEGKQVAYFNVQLEFLCKYIREFETTQSFYRYIYRDFLNEVALEYKLQLENDIRRVEELGERWHSLGEQMLKMKKDNSDIKKKIQTFIYELKILYKAEKDFAEQLINSCI